MCKSGKRELQYGVVLAEFRARSNGSRPTALVMCCTCLCGVLLLVSAQGGEARKGGGLRKARPSPWHAADGTGGVRSADGVKPVFAAGFKELIGAAEAHPRRRRMTDFTRSPSENGLQNMMNAWSEGSYSPVHLHEVTLP